MYDVPTNVTNESEDRGREEHGREESDREQYEQEERDRVEPESDRGYEEPDCEGSGNGTYEKKLRILDKIEDLRQQRQRLKDQMREWEREYCDDERHPIENYREKDYVNTLPEDSKQAYEDYEEVKDNIEDLEMKLKKLDVKLRRLRDEKEAEAECYEDLFKSSRKELLRMKEKRDKVLVKIQEQLQLEREGAGEMKMVEHESDDIHEAIRECQEDLDLINQYDVDLDTKSIMSLQEMTSSLDRDIEVLSAQAKNAVEEERRYEAQRKQEQEEADVQCENLAILRRKEQKVIARSRAILKEFKAAFNLLRYADIAREENSRPRRSIVAGFFSRRQDPMSNEKYDLCRRSNKKIEDTLRSIPNELQPRRCDEENSESETMDDFNAELRSLIIHLLTKTAGSMMEFNELLLSEHDFGDDRMYKLMHDKEESFEYENEIEMVKANANSTEYTRTLKRLKTLKKQNQKLRDEREFRKESMKKFQDSQNKYRKQVRDNKNQLKDINEYEIDNRQMREEVEDLQNDIKNITTQLDKRNAQLNDARDLVWSSVRNVGSDKRGEVRERRHYDERRTYTDYNPSDSDDAESLREHALQEISRWEDEDLHGRSKRAEPSRYPRSRGKDSNDRKTRGRDSYNTPGGYDSPRGPGSPKGRRSRSPQRGRDSRQRRTPGYDEYDNKCEDPPIGDSPEVYRDGSRQSRSVRDSTPPDRSPHRYNTRGGSQSPSPPLER